MCVCTHTQTQTHTHTHTHTQAQGWADTAGKPGGGGGCLGCNFWLHLSFKVAYLTAARQAPLRVVTAFTSQSVVYLKTDSKDNVSRKTSASLTTLKPLIVWILTVDNS